MSYYSCSDEELNSQLSQNILWFFLTFLSIQGILLLYVFADGGVRVNGVGLSALFNQDGLYQVEYVALFFLAAGTFALILLCFDKLKDKKYNLLLLHYASDIILQKLIDKQTISASTPNKNLVQEKRTARNAIELRVNELDKLDDYANHDFITKPNFIPYLIRVHKDNLENIRKAEYSAKYHEEQQVKDQNDKSEALKMIQEIKDDI